MAKAKKIKRFVCVKCGAKFSSKEICGIYPSECKDCRAKHIFVAN